MFFQKRLSETFCLAKSNLVVLILRLPSCLHLMVKPLCSLWWHLLLIVGSDVYNHVLEKVLDLANCREGASFFFFFTRESTLLSSTAVVFHGLLGLLVLLSSPGHFFFFFLRMLQTIDLATPNYFEVLPMGLFGFFSVTMPDSSLDLLGFNCLVMMKKQVNRSPLCM